MSLSGGILEGLTRKRASMVTKYVSKKYANYWIAAAIVLAVAVIGWLYTSGGASWQTTSGDTAQQQAPQPSVSVAVNEQAAGDSVAIARMQLDAVSWVAVRDERSILGAARFEAAATSGSVPLLRATVSGAEYRVVVYRDNGDRVFDHTVDALVADVSDTFRAQ